MNEPLRSDTAAAALLLQRLRPLFDQSAAALARACSKGSTLDAALLDEHQPTSYELAWACADLLAAQAAVEEAGDGAGELQVRLSLLFTVEAIAAVLPRLEAIHLEFDL